MHYVAFDLGYASFSEGPPSSDAPKLLHPVLVGAFEAEARADGWIGVGDDDGVLDAATGDRIAPGVSPVARRWIACLVLMGFEQITSAVRDRVVHEGVARRVAADGDRAVRHRVLPDKGAVAVLEKDCGTVGLGRDVHDDLDVIRVKYVDILFFAVDHDVLADHRIVRARAVVNPLLGLRDPAPAGFAHAIALEQVARARARHLEGILVVPEDHVVDDAVVVAAPDPDTLPKAADATVLDLRTGRRVEMDANVVIVVIAGRSARQGVANAVEYDG